jgi:TPR repeat protein
VATVTSTAVSVASRAFAALAGWGSLALLALAACDRPRGSQEDTPAPSASVVSIGVTMGTCSDLATCESECDGGSADRCRRLAASYAFGEGAAKDEAKATALYEHACDLGDPPGCVFAGHMHEYARGVPKDEARAASLYGRACDAGWAAGCYNQAIMFEDGRGVAVDRAKAIALYDTACHAGAKPACDKASALRGPPASDGGPPDGG